VSEDDAKRRLRLAGITDEEVAEFFRRVLPEMKCSVCGFDGLTVITRIGETGASPQLAGHKLESPLPSSLMAVTIVGCNNCGHIHLFSNGFMKLRLAEAPAAETGHDQPLPSS